MECHRSARLLVAAAVERGRRGSPERSPKIRVNRKARAAKVGAGANWVKGPMYGNGLEGFRADLMLEIIPGRTRELRMYGAKNDVYAEWVTVSVMNVIDESWVNILRYTFISLRD